ncbi:hypothetical protein [Pseudodesulfovibrio pelocollis]|uniref:hypothetical protein n=1 Tax=Pseudodesulfovibrio pelocollis TaxID=3051432 RepID=UPI00255ACC5D|nr:hypothetical protein [Pseudodesulfovibrio sp. SB368]
MARWNMDDRLYRLCEAMGVRDHVELAAVLNVARVHPSDIRTNGISARWLLRAVERGYNPQWIETGKGGKHLIPSNYPYFADYNQPVGHPSEYK